VFHRNRSSRRRVSIALAAVAILTLPIGSLTARQKPMAEIPLFVWFGAQADGGPGGLTSDGRQVSVTLNGVTTTADYANGSENVQAVLQPSGNFRFNTQVNTKKTAVRHLCVDFGAQLNGLSMQPLPNSYQCVTIEQPMHGYATGDVAIQNLSLNQQVLKLTRFAWTESGYRWRIGYGTDMNQDGTLDSSPVAVTCIEANSSGTCTTWLMTPSTDGAAALFRFLIARNGSEGPAEFVANVTMPFSMKFHRQ
jgi:hypothetical protein